jgi:hypothetical protein
MKLERIYNNKINKWQLKMEGDAGQSMIHTAASRQTFSSKSEIKLGLPFMVLALSINFKSFA